MQHADSVRWHGRDGRGHRCKTDTVTVDGGARGASTYASGEIAVVLKGFLDDCRKVVSQVTCR